METLTIRLPDELASRLRHTATEKAMSRSDCVRQALQNYLAESERVSPSALDLLGDLVGIGEGPGDLSTNKRYLRDIGR